MRSRSAAAILILGVLGGLVAWYAPVLSSLMQANGEVAELQSEFDTLKQRNDKLRGEIERLKTPEGIEEVARADFGYVRPGENVYVVTGLGDGGDVEKADTKGTAAADSAPKASEPVEPDAKPSADDAPIQAAKSESPETEASVDAGKDDPGFFTAVGAWFDSLLSGK